ncbi:carbonic anhydrase [Verrucomicrobiota bacterium]|nr:carbonic anhydrase [Verrucomicrobiota bacterium]
MKMPAPQKLLALLAAVGLFAGCQTSRPLVATAQNAASQAATTPAEALARLKAGNERFAANHLLTRDLAAQRVATAGGQYPFAVVLSCLDSRTSAELIFDQGIGDVFNARVAGNILNDDILGSMEFACKAAGAKLIAVVGHSKCGAVKGACGSVELGHLTGLLQRIQPAVAAVPPGADPTSTTRVDAVARENVKLAMRQIRERSPILAELIRGGKVGLVGGLHDLESGRVAFFE